MSISPISGITELDNFLPPVGVVPGRRGMVPAPQPGDELRFLRGDGTWAAGGGGGGGSPGGATNALQYNAGGGVFGGATQLFVNSTGGLDIVSQGEPVAPGASTSRLWSQTRMGREILRFKGPGNLSRTLALDRFYIARNVSGGTIFKGQAVAFSGATGNVGNVVLASAATATILCAGIAEEDIPNMGFGFIALGGEVVDINTSAFSDGAVVFLSTTLGAFTATPPAHPNYRQVIGIVIRAHATQGILAAEIRTALGGDSGTNVSLYRLGTALAGAQTLRFVNNFTLDLIANPSAARTITLPDLSGTVALVAGTNTQVQYNNNGALGGAALTQINATGGLDLFEQTEPATPAADTLRLWVQDKNGRELLTIKGPGDFNRVLARDNVFVARNTSVSTILKGQIVTVVGSTGQTPNVQLARADAVSTVGFGIAAEDIANNGFGFIQVIGLIGGLNTNTIPEGTELYLSASVAGAFTATPPVHPNLRQVIGTVVREHATQGIIGVDIGVTLGNFEGTRQNTFKIGNAAAGAKTLDFVNTFTMSLTGNPSAARVLTLPDVTGTLAVVAGSNKQVQYNNSGMLGGSSQAEVDTGGFLSLVSQSSTVSAAESGRLRVYSREFANRALLTQTGPTGLVTSLQPNIFANKIATWSANGNATTALNVYGIAAPTAVGTATARNVATTNLFTSMRRLGYVSAAGANSLASLRGAALQFFRGSGSNGGGFFCVFRFGISDASFIATGRLFVGLVPSTSAPTDVDPNTQINIIGIGKPSSVSTFRVYHNDGSGTATEIDLGANFPSDTTNTDMYEFSTYCLAGSSEIGYQVRRLNTGHVASGVITTDLPNAAQLLNPVMWRSNGTTATAVGLDVVGFYIETDN